MAKIKDKERSLKAARECQIITYKGVLIKLSTDFSTETFQTKRGWHEIFKVMKSKDLQPRVLYAARLSFKTEGEIKSFPDKKKLKEFIITIPVLQKMLKGLLEKEGEGGRREGGKEGEGGGGGRGGVGEEENIGTELKE